MAALTFPQCQWRRHKGPSARIAAPAAPLSLCGTPRRFQDSNTAGQYQVSPSSPLLHLLQSPPPPPRTLYPSLLFYTPGCTPLSPSQPCLPSRPQSVWLGPPRVSRATCRREHAISSCDVRQACHRHTHTHTRHCHPASLSRRDSARASSATPNSWRDCRSVATAAGTTCVTDGELTDTDIPRPPRSGSFTTVPLSHGGVSHSTVATCCFSA